MRTVFTQAAFAAALVSVLGASATHATEPTSAEERLVTQIEALAKQLDRANARLAALAAERPIVDLSRAAAAQQVARIVEAMDDLDNQLDGLRRARQLAALKARSARLLGEIEELQAKGTPDLAAHPTVVEWRRVRAELARMEEAAERAKAADAPLTGAEIRLRLGDPDAFDPGTASSLSIGVTFTGVGIGLAMFALGFEVDSIEMFAAGTSLFGLSLVLGPSAGHLYAGQTGRAWGFSAVRLGAYGLGIGLGFLSFVTGAMALVLPLVSMPLVGFAITLTVIDMIDAPRAARRASKRARMKFRVVPAVMRTDDGAAPGLVLSGRF